MFQSYTFEYKGYDQAADQYLYEITIVDPDFGEERVVAKEVEEHTMASLITWSAVAVIQLYSGKGYSVNQVAKNLWLLFEFNQRQYPWWPIKEQIKLYLEYSPEYLPYHADIQMLMLFS
jgi:hypothetical protein